MSVYYANSTNCTAYKVSGFGGGAGGFNGYAGAAELNATDKGYISTDDSNSYDNTTDNALRWDITIAEAEGDVTAIALEVKVENTGSYDTNLYIWKDSTSAWEKLKNVDCTGGKTTISHTVSANIANYIDGNDKIYFATVDTSDSGTTKNYYGSCTITTNGGGSAVPVIMRAYRNRREN